MRIVADQRKVILGVGEFARFSGGNLTTPAFDPGNWRALAGTRWHKWLREAGEREGLDASYEVPLEASVMYQQWTLEISGRVDQVLRQGNQTVLREIKTITCPLPLEEARLREQYPDYFRQAAAYRQLALAGANALSGDPQVELLFIDLNEGVTQSIRLTAEETDQWFQDQAACLVDFLNERRRGGIRRQSMPQWQPFAEPRPGQEAILQQLGDACNRSRIVLWEAPTGFGKTRAVLAHCLNAMRDGLFDRIIYLSGKSTGQIQVMRELKSIRDDSDGPWSLQLRSRAEYSANCTLSACDGWNSCRNHQQGLQPITQCREWFRQAECDGAVIRQHSADSRICPHAIARAALPYADIWVGDYNYVFSPRHRGVLESVAGYDPGSAILLVDEAHNLPDRVRDNLGFHESSAHVRALTRFWEQAGASIYFLDAWECWAGFLEQIPQSKEHTGALVVEAFDLVSRLIDAAKRRPIEWDHLSANALDYWFSLEWKRTLLQQASADYLIWSASAGEFRFACLDSSREINSTLLRYGQVVLMSATLAPAAGLADDCGLGEADYTCLQSNAPWRDEAYNVAVDCRVDTRLSRRARHYADVAETIMQVCRNVPAPVAVFFPSYQYSETIHTYIKELDPSLWIEIQPRAVGLDGQMRFLEESLLCAHALFFILGSGFSESIDQLGGRTGAAIVVGPALPEVNPFREAVRTRWSHLPTGEAFRRAYQIPAMRKINQALGRMVRAPGQAANVLLLCRRFAEPAYFNLLRPEYQNASRIQNQAGLDQWLARAGTAESADS